MNFEEFIFMDSAEKMDYLTNNPEYKSEILLKAIHQDMLKPTKRMFISAIEDIIEEIGEIDLDDLSTNIHYYSDATGVYYPTKAVKIDFYGVITEDGEHILWETIDYEDVRFLYLNIKDIQEERA